MKRKSLHDQIAEKCIHFNGTGKSKCEAGMVYDEVDKDMRIEYRSGLPCIKPDEDSLLKLDGRHQCHCPHLQFPTEEEVQKELDMWEAQVQKMDLALSVISPIRKARRGKDWQGMVKCPNCNGNLHVRHSGFNGHVWAKCETPDCVSWIE